MPSLKSLAKKAAKKVTKRLVPTGPLPKLAKKAGKAAYKFGKEKTMDMANEAAHRLGGGPRMMKNHEALEKAMKKMVPMKMKRMKIKRAFQVPRSELRPGISPRQNDAQRRNEAGVGRRHRSKA